MTPRQYTGVRWSTVAAALLLTACASQPPTPNWALQAHSASERAVQAQLKGQTAVAQLEWAKAFREVAATAQPAAMARLALLQCAVQTAVLAPTDCPRYQNYAAAAAVQEQAYARYLRNQHTASDVQWLPAQQQALAQQLLAASASPITPEVLAQPLSQLTAAGVAARAGVLSAKGVQHAVQVASEQGWGGAVRAWLKLEHARALQAADQAALQKVQLQLQVLHEGEKASSPPP